MSNRGHLSLRWRARLSFLPICLPQRLQGVFNRFSCFSLWRDICLELTFSMQTGQMETEEATVTTTSGSIEAGGWSSEVGGTTFSVVEVGEAITLEKEVEEATDWTENRVEDAGACPPCLSCCRASSDKSKESSLLRILRLYLSFIEVQVAPCTTCLSSISCHNAMPSVSAHRPF